MWGEEGNRAILSDRIRGKRKAELMINNSVQEKIENIILSFLVVLGVYAITACCFDFFYDLNDDMVIKDILAGAYSGIPDGHTNQMLYPIGWLISGIYRILPGVPVFGIFLCMCFGICFFMISYRMQKLFGNIGTKIATVVLLILVFLSLMVWELVYVQYSVVCGCLAGTACFWFITTPTESTLKEWWKQNLPALILVWLAFNIRSEMLLLTCPLIAAAGICHWMDTVKLAQDHDTVMENKSLWSYILSKENIGKYLVFIITMILGAGMFLGMDSLAYRHQGWQEYRKFFDARTRVYDYTWYPDYEEQKEFYDTHGIEEIQYRLIDNYNFGLDESITENTLDIIASFGERPKMFGSLSYRIKQAAMDMVQRTFSKEDMPYNLFVLAGYGLMIGLAVLQKEKRYLGKLGILLVMRFISWFYLLFVQRAVDRITHPLYIIEFMILLAMLIRELYDRPLWNEEKYYRMIAAGVLSLAALISLPFGYQEVKNEQNRREQLLVNQKLWEKYAKANPDKYYYLDVYSTVSFMEKMYENVDNSQKNYDLLGGWICNSPLQQEARAKYTESQKISEALLTDNFYVAAAANRDIAFVEDFYKSRNMKIELELQDTVGEGENPFVIYKVTEQKETAVNGKKKK